MTPPSDELVVTEVHDRVLLVRLNRPDALNALNGAVVSGLLGALHRLDGDPDLAVGILCAEGRAFCAGMDLKAFAAEGSPQGLSEIYRNGATKPLVAAVEGFAYGGGLELALTCDVIVAGRDARFGLPEVKVGLFAAGGGVLRLTKHVPAGVALQMALSGEPLVAEEAHRWGLVTRLTEPGQAVDEAMALATTIAANAPLSLAVTKRLIRESSGLPETAAWELQDTMAGAVFTSNDAKEGPRAFAERRPPVWSGS